MRIEQLLENHKYSRKQLLKESCDGLTQQQRTIVENIYNEFVPLIEATLTADQVKDIFKGVEQAAVAGGDNRTLAGLGVDGAKKVNDIIDKAGKWLQDTTPVKNFDAKFEKLKNDINTKFPDSKILDGVSNLAIWVQDNPGKTAAVIGILTALASLAGGPVGGAIAGQVLKGATELLKGEKLSTAIVKGLKAAAVGWLAGKSMEAVGKMIANAYEYFNPQPIHGFVQYYQENIGNGLPNIFRDAHIVGNKEQLGQFNQMWSGAAKQWQSGNFEGAREAFSQAQDFAIKITSETYKAMGTTDPGEPIRKLNDLFTGLSAAAQGAATGAAGYDKQGKPVEAAKESYYRQTRPLSEGQVYVVLKRIAATEQLNEGPMDWIKKGAAAVGKGIDRVGQNITNKVTYEKLLAGWKLDGSPMDSEELKKFLASMEVSPDIVNKVFTDMKIDGTGAAPAETPAAASAYKQVKDQVLKLNTTQRKRIASYLQKQLGTA